MHYSATPPGVKSTSASSQRHTISPKVSFLAHSNKMSANGM